MADLKALLQERAKLVADARAINDAAEAEKRELTGEERAQFDTLITQAEKLGDQIRQEERLREQERQTEQRRAEEDRGSPPTPDEASMRNFIVHGDRRGLRLAGESRDLEAGSAPDGGYIVTPQMFVTQLIKFIDDMVFIRGLATTYQLGSAGSLGAPELTADPADADWTTELSTGSADTAMQFGKREMYTHPLAKRIKISRDLLRRSALPIEALVQQRLAYKFGITQEKAFMTGNGDRQPLGVFTASSSGISTARDVSEDNTATQIRADGLISAKYKLKAQYMANAVWIFHRDATKQIAKLKDNEGRYMMQPALTMGMGDMLLGRPMFMSEHAPNTFTANSYVGIFGDFSHYWIADALDMRMQRLEELYAETNQVGFIARQETDGAPVLEEAFARVQLAAS